MELLGIFQSLDFILFVEDILNPLSPEGAHLLTIPKYLQNWFGDI